MNIDAVWSDPGRAPACMAWTRNFWEAIRPYSTGRVYVNSLGEEGQDRVQAAYGDAKYERLRAQADVRPDKPVPSQPEHPAVEPTAGGAAAGRRSGEPIPG